MEGNAKVTVSSCHIQMVEHRVVLCCLAVQYFQAFVIHVARELDPLFFSFLLVHSPLSSVPLLSHETTPQLSLDMTRTMSWQCLLLSQLLIFFRLFFFS